MVRVVYISRGANDTCDFFFFCFNASIRVMNPYNRTRTKNTTCHATHRYDSVCLLVPCNCACCAQQMAHDLASSVTRALSRCVHSTVKPELSPQRSKSHVLWCWCVLVYTVHHAKHNIHAQRVHGTRACAYNLHAALRVSICMFLSISLWQRRGVCSRGCNKEIRDSRTEAI